MKLILIVEDKPTEQEIAKKIVGDSGARVVVASTLSGANRIMDALKGKISAVITDLHFPEDNNANSQAIACGVAVVIRALQEKIPVSICSDVNHHRTEYLKSVVDGLQSLTGQKVHFTMDFKDWKSALDSLKL